MLKKRPEAVFGEVEMRPLPLRALVLSCFLLVNPAHAQDTLKPGTGAATVVRACTSCHTINMVTDKPRSDNEWGDILGRMMDKGLVASEDQLDEIYAYLTSHYSNSKSRKAPPSNAPATSNKR